MQQHASNISNHDGARPKRHKRIFPLIFAPFVGIALLFLLFLVAFEKHYEGKVYPTVSVGGVAVGGKTPQQVQTYWLAKNTPFTEKTFEFHFENKVATVSAIDLDLGYDATLSATQAYLVGRSGHWGSDIIAKFFQKRTDLTPYFRWNTDILDDMLQNLSETINIPVQEALFEFASGKVTSFKPSKAGRKLNIDKTMARFGDTVSVIPQNPHATIPIALVVEPVKPSITTDQTNNFGIKELIGRGYSEFAGSIPGRIYNVQRASSKLHGVLIKPGDTFSFNETVGDVSAATGYQQAYVIKDGRTVLGDGGGLCQVSSTLFRAALDTGLSIVERKAHAYRVHYYEEGGFKPGLDATVFAPSVDLKIKNDTPGYILIQTKADIKNLTLTFELYGTKDGRKAEIFNHKVWDITSPPPDLYQDDPTLPHGVVRQVDFAAWGTKASFQYRVTRDGQTLQDETFFSNFRPWQAIYLKGV